MKKSAEIASAAEERAFEIAKLSEAECKAYREKSVKQAEADARETLKNAEADCKRYRETELKKAEENAENAYRVALSDQKREAKAYAEGILKTAKPAVGRIVRRICG